MVAVSEEYQGGNMQFRGTPTCIRLGKMFKHGKNLLIRTN